MFYQLGVFILYGGTLSIVIYFLFFLKNRVLRRMCLFMLAGGAYSLLQGIWFIFSQNLQSKLLDLLNLIVKSLEVLSLLSCGYGLGYLFYWIYRHLHSSKEEESRELELGYSSKELKWRYWIVISLIILGVLLFPDMIFYTPKEYRLQLNLLTFLFIIMILFSTVRRK